MINMTKLNKGILLCLGFLLILYTFYIRFLVIRLPKYLDIITNFDINYKVIILLLSGIFGSLYLIYNNVKTLYNIQTKRNIFSKISLLIEEALFECYLLITKYIPNITEKIASLCDIFYWYFQNITEALFVLLLQIIRLIILITFLYDVFVCFKLHYFYITLYLLSISLIIQIIIYILRDFSKNAEDFEKAFIIEETFYEDEVYTNFKLKEEYYGIYDKETLNLFILSKKMMGYLAMYDKYHHYFSPRFNIIIYTLYFTGWLYVLFKNGAYLLEII